LSSFFEKKEILENKVKYFTSEAILEGIRLRNNEILNFVYKKFYPFISAFIICNSGDEQDAKDIFQEAIIIIYRKTKQGKLELNCPFNAYLHSVCRILWLQQLKKKKLESEELKNLEIFINPEIDITEEIKENYSYRLYQIHFKKLGKDCQKLLLLFFDRVPLKKIAEIMGYKSAEYAKRRKYLCKKSLIKSIKSDQEFKKD